MQHCSPSAPGHLHLLQQWHVFEAKHLLQVCCICFADMAVKICDVLTLLCGVADAQAAPFWWRKQLVLPYHAAEDKD